MWRRRPGRCSDRGSSEVLSDASGNRTSTDPEALVESAVAGDRRDLGRLLTAIENRSRDVPALTRALSRQSGEPHVVGVTGAPGVGKSTTTSALVGHWRAQGLRVAVLAVDPSSPFTGGALLGDRIRMDDHATDDGVFIRSMAARGHLGGLAAATPAAVRTLGACGFDKVLVETVGVGQSEVDIVKYADTVAILLAPGMGDRIQAAKAGLLEIGDVFGINKSDRTGARATERELSAMVAMKPLGDQEWRPPVLPLVATEGRGIPEFSDLLDDHLKHGLASGAVAQRRRDRVTTEISSLMLEMWDARAHAAAADTDALATEILAGRSDPYSAAEDLFARLSTQA